MRSQGSLANLFKVYQYAIDTY